MDAVKEVILSAGFAEAVRSRGETLQVLLDRESEKRRKIASVAIVLEGTELNLAEHMLQEKPGWFWLFGGNKEKVANHRKAMEEIALLEAEIEDMEPIKNGLIKAARTFIDAYLVENDREFRDLKLAVEAMGMAQGMISVFLNMLAMFSQRMETRTSCGPQGESLRRGDAQMLIDVAKLVNGAFKVLPSSVCEEAGAGPAFKEQLFEGSFAVSEKEVTDPPAVKAYADKLKRKAEGLAETVEGQKNFFEEKIRFYRSSVAEFCATGKNEQPTGHAYVIK